MIRPGIVMIASAIMLAGCHTVERVTRVTDGTNFALGFRIPATDVSLAVADYVGGLSVTSPSNRVIEVTHEVDETNSYFGIVSIVRHSKMKAKTTE